jgi:hypothetical protein
MPHTDTRTPSASNIIPFPKSLPGYCDPDGRFVARQLVTQDEMRVLADLRQTALWPDIDGVAPGLPQDEQDILRMYRRLPAARRDAFQLVMVLIRAWTEQEIDQ